MIDSGLDILEEIENGLKFFERVDELRKKRQKLEQKLVELTKVLQPYSYRIEVLRFENGSFIVRKKNLELSVPTAKHSISSLEFYDLLKSVPDDFIHSLDNIVKKELQGCLPKFLIEGKNLKGVLNYTKSVEKRTLRLFYFYQDKPSDISIDTVQLNNGTIRFHLAGGNVLSEYFEPFRFTIQRMLNVLVLKQQMPEVFTIFDEMFKQYDSDLDYNFDILKKMELTISPFVIAKKVGRH
jgi:hypothetical protein